MDKMQENLINTYYQPHLELNIGHAGLKATSIGRINKNSF